MGSALDPPNHAPSLLLARLARRGRARELASIGAILLTIALLVVPAVVLIVVLTSPGL